MNDDERARILRMVAEGKISPEEGAELLEAIQQERRSSAPIPPEPPQPPRPPRDWNSAGRRSSRFLIIQIKDGEQSKMNLRIPLGLAKTAGKFIPRNAQNYLGKYEINLQELLDEVADSEGGTLLEVRDGDDKVLIAVE